MSNQNEIKWCAWCGKWGDHTSGECLDLLSATAVSMSNQNEDKHGEIIFLQVQRFTAEVTGDFTGQPFFDYNGKRYFIDAAQFDGLTTKLQGEIRETSDETPTH